MKHDLTERAKLIYQDLEIHCKKMGLEKIFYLELEMLADAFASYFESAEYCAKHGNVYNMPTKTGTYPMIRPEYTVKNKEYQNILKHSAKYGLNPQDFDKLKSLRPERSKKKFGKSEFDLSPRKNQE